MSGHSINFAARVADLICQSDALIAAGVIPAVASRKLGVPHNTMRHWRKKTRCPEPSVPQP